MYLTVAGILTVLAYSDAQLWNSLTSHYQPPRHQPSQVTSHYQQPRHQPSQVTSHYQQPRHQPTQVSLTSRYQQPRHQPSQVTSHYQQPRHQPTQYYYGSHAPYRRPQLMTSFANRVPGSNRMNSIQSSGSSINPFKGPNVSPPKTTFNGPTRNQPKLISPFIQPKPSVQQPNQNNFTQNKNMFGQQQPQQQQPQQPQQPQQQQQQQQPRPQQQQQQQRPQSFGQPPAGFSQGHAGPGQQRHRFGQGQTKSRFSKSRGILGQSNDPFLQPHMSPAGRFGGAMGGAMGGMGTGRSSVPLTPKIRALVHRLATQLGHWAYYSAHGCVDPATVLLGRKQAMAHTAMLAGCSSPLAQDTCAMTQLAGGGGVGKMMSFMMPHHTKYLLEKCISPSRMLEGMTSMMGSPGGSGVTPPHGAAGTQSVDCSGVTQMLMMSSPEGGMFTPEAMEHIGIMRKQYLPMQCQEEVILGLFPLRMCCPGTVSPPTKMEVMLLKGMGGGA